eukprot:CAMPEP_0172418492 /NCGR_PEP_ID=MMETSP1064-20121228/4961_1 /TAXON_ID=202472 /ORGANISM="Aulacoseira subarctica , Strain CCAP 1002/5" /LENGTH=1268 /DNA_ID=CAMNT_0013157441 /DNA_START=253 /DNA_END=4059 /DNA_ORIENTATION=-
MDELPLLMGDNSRGKWQHRIQQKYHHLSPLFPKHDSTKGRTSIIICAVDGTVYTLDAATGNVRGFFNSGDALVDSSQQREEKEKSFYLIDKIVPGLDGYIYQLSSETNTVTTLMPYNVTDVINQPVKTCHPIKKRGGDDMEEEVGEICGIVTGEKKSKIFALNVQTGRLSWIHSDEVKLGRRGSTTRSLFGTQHHSFSATAEDEPTHNNHDAANVLLQREDFLVRHVDVSTGEENWNVRLANFQAWEFPSSSDKDSFSNNNVLAEFRASRTTTKATKATPFEGIYASALPKKSTIPELKFSSPSALLPASLPSIAFSEDGKIIVAIDAYSGNVLWRKPFPSTITMAYGVTSDNSWIKLQVVDESDYLEKLHITRTDNSQGCESELVSSHTTSADQQLQVAYNSNHGQVYLDTALVPYDHMEKARVGRHASTLFVSSTSTNSLPSKRLPSKNTIILAGASQQQPMLFTNEKSLAVRTFLESPSLMDQAWSTPSFGKFHKLEHGLFLTWQGVTIVAAMLIAGIALVRFSYLKQKKKWTRLLENSPLINPSSNYSAIQKELADMETTSSINERQHLPHLRSLDAGDTTTQASDLLSGLPHLKKRTASLPIIRPVAQGSTTTAATNESAALDIFAVNASSHDVFAFVSSLSKGYDKLKTSASEAKEGPSNTTASDVLGSSNSYYLQNVPSSVDGIPLVRYSRYKSEFNDLSSLGKGGFGTVFRCRNVLDGREYAVKKIRIKSFVDQLGVSTKHLSNALRRVLREVKILALLDHPNIVRYYTAWLEIDDGFSVLEEESGAHDNSSLSMDYKKKYSTSQFSDKSKNIKSSAQPQSASMMKNKSQQDILSELRNCTNATGMNEDLGFSWDRGLQEPSNGAEESSFADDIDSQEEKSSFREENLVYPTVPASLMKQRYILYIQMQLCSQSTLSDFLSSPEKRRRGLLCSSSSAQDTSDSPLSSAAINIPHALQVFSQIVRGVKHVHEQGLIHRDLKPSNCFIDEMGTVKIGDFGLSRETVKSGIEEVEDDCEGVDNKNAPDQTESITVGVGTRSYASPEQINGSDYDASTDVYSLGIMLFELCYRMSTNMERYLVFSNLRQRIFPAEWVSTVANSFPTLHDLLNAMLSPNPSERPSSSVVSSHIEKLLGEFVFSLGRGWERKGERALLLRVEAIDVEGILPRTINMIKLAAPAADIVQYGLKGQGNKAIMEFALAFPSDEHSSAESASIAQLNIFRTLNASDEIQLIREVSTDLCPNLEQMGKGKMIFRSRSSLVD